MTSGFGVSWILAGSPGPMPGVAVAFGFAAAPAGGAADGSAFPPVRPKAFAPSRPNSSPASANSEPINTRVLSRTVSSFFASHVPYGA